MGNSFVHGQITFALAIRFIFMRKIIVLVCANPNNIIVCANVFLHGQKVVYIAHRKKSQNFAQARQHVGHTPKSFMAGNEALQAPAETANQLYYLQVLLKAIL